MPKNSKMKSFRGTFNSVPFSQDIHYCLLTPLILKPIFSFNKMLYTVFFCNNELNTFSLCFRELEEARVQQNNPPRPKIGLGTQSRNSRLVGQKVNRSMSLSVIM